MRDTIAAIATPVGAGGIGIVRLSGPDAAAIAATLVRRESFEDRRLVRAVARDPESGELSGGGDPRRGGAAVVVE